MHALNEAAERWLTTQGPFRSDAVRDCLMQRLKEAPLKENWSHEDRTAAATRLRQLQETTRPQYGFLGCGARE